MQEKRQKLIDNTLQQFDGEVHSRVKTEREPGVCIKHSMRNNRLKMYDKFGLILRVETVIRSVKKMEDEGKLKVISRKIAL